MAYRAIYAYAWDIAEAGTSDFVVHMRALGLDTVTIAGSYHAGKFIRPKGRPGKIYFPEDGTAYFRFDPARYGRIKPVANSLLATRDVLRELCEEREIATNAWMVLLHNTRIGLLHPEATATNAFGDRYFYSLCPSAPEVREYAVALCKDVTDNYPVIGVSLETPGFLPFQHGFHHEFGLIRQNRWLDSLLGLCFCEHCIRGAGEQGDRRKRPEAKSRARCRGLSRRRCRFSGRHGRSRSGSRISRTMPSSRRSCASGATSSPRWSRKSAPRCAAMPRLPSSPPSPGRPRAPGTRAPTSPLLPERPISSRRASTSRASSASAPTSST